MKLGLIALAFALPAAVACGGSHEAAKSPGGAYANAGYAPAMPASEVAASAAPPAPPGTPAAAGATSMSAAKSTAKVESEAPIAMRDPRQVSPQSGLLTAGVWDDNKNFDFFLGFTRKTAQAGSDFNAFSESELTQARTRHAQARAQRKQGLDVSIVFDTTGSMGDELSFIQNEMLAISAALKNRMPDVTPRFSLVVYRDQGDEYVTKRFDFTSNVRQFQKTLAEQSAGGGGDYPEAVVEGLGVAASLEWRGQPEVAKVAFWIADAPTHPGEGRQFNEVVGNLTRAGVHVYPIAASGANELTEYEMRSAAVMTGGRYIFLTDDSGVGNSHAEPHIPCYSVTRLDRAIVRVLETEVSGKPVPVGEQDVLRKVGSPRADGTCVLGSGELVAAF